MPVEQGDRRARRQRVVHTAVVTSALMATLIGCTKTEPGAPAASSHSDSPTVSQAAAPPPEPISGQRQLPFSGLSSPEGIAVDAAGNVYVTDFGHVWKLPAGSTTAVELPFKGPNDILFTPHAVAVDATGNVYVAESLSQNPRVLKLAPGDSQPTTLPFSDLKSPAGVAVDKDGNVYAADFNDPDNITGRVLKLAAGATSSTVLPFTDIKRPTGIAVDNAGSVYVSDDLNTLDTLQNQLHKLPAGSSSAVRIPITAGHITMPKGVATDQDGNVYIVDGTSVVRLAGGTADQAEVSFTGLKDAAGAAVDIAGNVYVVDKGQPAQVLERGPA